MTRTTPTGRLKLLATENWVLWVSYVLAMWASMWATLLTVPRFGEIAIAPTVAAVMLVWVMITPPATLAGEPAGSSLDGAIYRGIWGGADG